MCISATTAALYTWSTFRTFRLPTVRWTERTSILRTRGNDLSRTPLIIPQMFNPLKPGEEREIEWGGVVGDVTFVTGGKWKFFWGGLKIPSQSAGLSVKLLLVFASTVILGFESRRDSWPYFSFQDFYVLWNGASSSTTSEAWLLLVTPLLLGVFQSVPTCISNKGRLERRQWLRKGRRLCQATANGRLYG
jgi:hypothetical protein